MAISTAIRHLKQGDWEKAHALVREDGTPAGCWAHGLVHLIEGDIGNARYWYRRAGRPFPAGPDAGAEIEALAAAIKRRRASQVA